MHDDLASCIQTARASRDQLLDGKLSVAEANAITGANHIIISAHALDLRERMFLADVSDDEAVARLTGEHPGDSPRRARRITSEQTPAA